MAVSLFGDDEDFKKRRPRPAGHAGRPEGAAGTPDPGGAGREADGLDSSRLDSSPNNRNQQTLQTFQVQDHLCRSRTCPTCGPIYGRKARRRLLAKAELFTRPALLTLTVDRKQFESAAVAFGVILENGFIRRILRLLKVKYWVWVLEFQMKTGEGWPHWHILVDLPNGGLDLERAWRLWRDRWKLGMLDLQRKPWTANGEAALLYISKYLCKYPKGGFPAWVEHYPKRIRWVQASKKVGAVLTDSQSGKQKPKRAPEEEEARKANNATAHRPLAVRKISCGELVDFFSIVQFDSGERKRFKGRLPRELFEAATEGRDGLVVSLDDKGRRTVTGTWEDFNGFYNRVVSLANERLRSKGGVMGIAQKHLKRLGEVLKEGGRHEPA